jgi:hypothetical protein
VDATNDEDLAPGAGGAECPRDDRPTLHGLPDHHALGDGRWRPRQTAEQDGPERETTGNVAHQLGPKSMLSHGDIDRVLLVRP